MISYSSKRKVSRKTLIAGLVISLLFPTSYVIFALPFLVKPNMEWQLENIIGLVFLWGITILLLVHIRFFEKRKFSSIGLKSISIKKISLSIGVGFICSLLIPLFYYGMMFLFDTSVENSIDNLSQRSPIFILSSIITAAITEEVLFRAYPLERLYELTGSNGIGIAVSLGAFLLLHSQSWNLLHILGVVLPLGILLTIIYLKTRSLLFLIIVHLVIDLPLFVTSLINQMGS
jgi:membrane protease YdiL (CAAX protease family)